MKKWHILSAVLAIIVIGAILASSITVVPAGHVGVVDFFGQVSTEELKPGIQFKTPLASVHLMSVRTQEYTMSISTEEGEKYGDDSITALTKEGLTVALDITVLYRLQDSVADKIYTTIGEDYIGVIVRPQIRTVIREVIAKYEAKQLYSEERQKVALEIAEKLEPELEKRGIALERVLLRNIKLPDSLTQKITEKLEAEQEAERMEFVLQKEQQEAERKRIEAQGIADANRIISNSLTPEYLRWYHIQMLPNYNSVIYIPIGEDGLPIFKNLG